MADPIMEAAQRALDELDNGLTLTLNDWDVVAQAAEAAAREALAPLRELHQPLVPTRYAIKCAECSQPWPCATALTCYTTEELNRE